jgi:hypothetical protein
MNKWFFAYLHLKKKIEGEASPLPQEHDSQIVFGFIEQCLKPIATAGVSGKFDRACKSIEIALEIFYEILKPRFSGDPEWFPVLLGIESGLLIAKQQLDFIGKEKRG